MPRLGGSAQRLLPTAACLTTVLCAAATLTAAKPAFAGWSALRAVRTGETIYLVRTSLNPFVTDARGDSALAWSSSRSAGRTPHGWYDSAVHVAFAGPSGPAVPHVVWRRTHSLVAGVSVALDSRGELTVAWVEAQSQFRGAISIRARRRAPDGRWSPVQLVGHSSTSFDYASPHLAVAPDNEVLLSWNAGTVAGIRAAWRAPGHAFGAAAVVGPSRRTGILIPTPIFDAGGGAHIYGTACGPHSTGQMLSTRGRAHRFAPPAIIAPAPAQDLVVSFAGRGRAIAAWQHEQCSADEPAPGTPYARVMLNGALQAPVALDPHGRTTQVFPVAARAGGGSVSWVSWPNAPLTQSETLSTTADAGGRFSAPGKPDEGLTPIASDRAGDTLEQELPQLDFLPLPTSGLAANPLAMRPATGGELEPSPLPPISGTPLARSLSSMITAVPSSGRGAAVVWQNGHTGAVDLATWSP